MLFSQYGDSREFLWRLARAYTDMYRSTEDKRDKRAYAHQGEKKTPQTDTSLAKSTADRVFNGYCFFFFCAAGREEAESALRKNGLNAECHKW